MLFLLIIVLTSSVIVLSTSQCYGKFDYYWREYKGTIPPDALPAIDGGCDGSIYIAQGFFLHAGILPAGLYGNKPEIEAAAQYKVFTTRKHVKVLCTPHPQLFKWKPTTSATFNSLKAKCELVYGGIEFDTTLYIGRKIQNGKLMVGKITKLADGEIVLTLPDKKSNNEIRHNEFEALTYDCQDSCNAGIAGISWY